MHPLLILREEIVCLIILLFFFFNGRFYKMGKDSGSFLRLSVFAIGHVILDIITVLTVNHADTVPSWFNWCAHVVFYLFAILFSYEFFCYTTQLCFSKKAVRRVRITGIIAPVLYLVLLPFLPIDYLHGNGTDYSFGMAAFVGYGIALVYFLCSIIVVIKHRKSIVPHVRLALFPMLLVMITAELLQIMVPEMLFTGGAVTIITVGFFFSLENPAAVFRKKVQIDALTGVESRHSYEADLQELEHRSSGKNEFCYGVAFCDINDLKLVNNRYGHLEGDAYISRIAQVLMQQLKSANKIYRMGGDEFLAMYFDKDEDVIKKEIDAVHATCKSISADSPYYMHVAIGYAMSGKDNPTIREVLKIADYRMYKNKTEMKRQMVYQPDDANGGLNITGLTDRIFDAFSFVGNRSYPFICNTETNVSRLSPYWVDEFGLPGEFIYDFDNLWVSYIHPDDRDGFIDDINSVLLGKKKEHNMEYRAKNKNGEYVVCTCRGSVFKGKRGEPDLFAGTMVNHGISEIIDPVTGLHNDQEMSERLRQMIEQGTPAVILKISIMTFSRINMLYGYSNGNDILRQFADLLKRIVGSDGEVFRADGTKFVIVLPGVTQEQACERYKEIRKSAGCEIRIAFSLIPLQIAGGAFIMGADFNGKPSAVLSSLIYAHDCSKYEQQGRLIFYKEAVTGNTYGDYRLLTDIHQDAINDRKGFFLRYQPIVQMNTGKIIGVEALLRWHNERNEEIGPDLFVPWLENDPCFYDLGLWIIRRTLTDIRTAADTIPCFSVGINVTVHQLQHDNFRNDVLEILKEMDFPPEKLCLELTERCKELDTAFLIQECKFFREHGIRVALDDVGTGSASFGLLLSLPLDEVKIDKTIVQTILEKRANQILTRSIVDACDSMKFAVCFEGIDDIKVFNYLKRYDDARCQGFGFSKPLKIKELHKFLKNYDSKPNM